MKLADIEAHYIIDDREYRVVIPVEASDLSRHDLMVTISVGELTVKPADGEYDAEFMQIEKEFNTPRSDTG